MTAYGILNATDVKLSMEWDEMKNLVTFKNAKNERLELTYEQLRELRCMIEYMMSDRYRRGDRA